MKRRPALTMVIASLAEANTVLVKIGELDREMETVKTELEASMAQMREVANTEIAPMEAERERLEKSLEIFAKQHRTTLLVDEKKSVVLPGGEFGWRLPPTKVVLTGGEKKAIETLTALDLKQYLRFNPEVNREALLEHRPAIEGVRYSQKENFYVKPETGREAQIFPGSAEAKKA